MKLIRCVSETTNGVFNCNFNADLTIPPKSKICLQSLHVEREDTTSSVIDIQANSVILTNALISDGSVSVVATLPAGTYNQRNILTETASSLNNAFSCPNTGSFPPIGRQYSVTNIKGYVNIGYETAVENKESSSSWIVRNVDEANGEFTVNDPAEMYSFNTFAATKHPIGKGCSKIQFTIADLDTGAAPDDTKGIIIGLTKKNPALVKNEYNLSDIEFGVQPNVVGQPVYLVEDDDTTEVTETASLTDAFAIEINMDETAVPNQRTARAIKYTSSATKTPIEIGNKVLDDDTDYWAVVLFVDEDSVPKVTNPFFTPDTSFTKNVDNKSSNPTIGRLFSGTASLKGYFQLTVKAATLFGYNNTYYPTDALTEAMLANESWTAETVMNSANRIDNYVVETLNLPVDSYDSFGGGQRRNVIAFIGEEDVESDITYRPQFPVWVNLNNATDITLRNIQMRVVNTDYSPIKTGGMPQAVLLIKTPSDHKC